MREYFRCYDDANITVWLRLAPASQLIGLLTTYRWRKALILHFRCGWKAVLSSIQPHADGVRPWYYVSAVVEKPFEQAFNHMPMEQNLDTTFPLWLKSHLSKHLTTYRWREALILRFICGWKAIPSSTQPHVDGVKPWYYVSVVVEALSKLSKDPDNSRFVGIIKLNINNKTDERCPSVCWYSIGESNPWFSRERAASWPLDQSSIFNCRGR